MDSDGGGNEYDGRAHDSGRPREDVVGWLIVRQSYEPHDRLIVVDVVHRQAALRRRHARDTGVYWLRQPGPVQSVAGAVQQTDGDDEDVRRDGRGPAPPVLALVATPSPPVNLRG